MTHKHGISNLLRNVLGHPLNRDRKMHAAWNVIAWQLSQRLFPSPSIVPFTSKTRLVVSKGMTGATGNIYCGLYEFADMAFLLHFLRPEDFFLDIGANVGVYTVLASAHVGASSMCFEPVPDTLKQLRDNISTNGIEQLVEVAPYALGESNGSVAFSNEELDTVNHIVYDQSENVNALMIEIRTLDGLELAQQPDLIKMDVEGFESAVIAGGGVTLKGDRLAAILVELNGSGERYGFSDTDTHKKLLDIGFHPCSYDPFERSLTRLENRSGSVNTLYVRDFNRVSERLSSASPVHLPFCTV